MTSFSGEIASLQMNELLPRVPEFFSTSRFTKSYKDVGELGAGVLRPIFEPIMNGFTSLMYAMHTVWDALRILGSLLILKPRDAAAAASDLGIHLSLTIALALMAPINAISSSIELFTNLVASWVDFGSKEQTHDLSSASFSAKLTAEKESLIADELLLSANYFRKAKFFTPYQGVGGFFQAAAAPIATPAIGAIESFTHALQATRAAFMCVSSLLICQPKHAGEAARDLGVHLSLSLALAAMIPLNAIMQAIAFVTRLGATWHAACQPDVEENHTSPAYAAACC